MAPPIRPCVLTAGGEKRTCGQLCQGAFSENELPCSRCPAKRCLASGESEIVETDIPRDKRKIEVRAVPLRSVAGEVTGIIEIIRDITEHRKLQAQLQQAQKLESVGRLAGGVAHDFNNMLAVILGYSEMGIASTAPESEMHRNLEEVFQVAQRARRLTRQLLAFASKQVLEMSDLNLNSVIHDFSKMIQRLIGEDISILMNLADEVTHIHMPMAQ